MITDARRWAERETIGVDIVVGIVEFNLGCQVAIVSLSGESVWLGYRSR